jgi:hypothetical protein
MKTYMMKRIALCMMFASFFTPIIQAQLVNESTQEKTRILILTDIENEPDDAMSLVRFLTYSNMFDVEGIVATTSCWQRDEIADWRIHQIVDAYGKVRDNLEKHEKGYPTHAFLKERIKKGIPQYGMAAVGKGKDSEGSDWVIEMVDKEDIRPVWITVWGGSNVLAQALWKVKNTRSEKDMKKFVSKIRIYTISDQDDSGPWIRNTFPELFYIVSPGYEENGGGQYHFATWVGIAGDKFHGRFDGPDFSIVDNPWMDVNVRKNHGPLGAEYPHMEYLMEGDTPSFLYLINNGLSNPENPNYGSWGGRYELYKPHTKKYFHEPETRAIWTDAVDEVYSPITKHNHTSNHATIWRWREAYQNDFSARMDWCVQPYNKANHPPIAQLAHNNELLVKQGEMVNLNGSKSSDPDKNKLSYNWIYYPEVGNFNGKIEIENPDNAIATFKAPRVDQTTSIHIILQVTDDGLPALTRYQRVLVTVIP